MRSLILTRHQAVLFETVVPSKRSMKPRETKLKTS